MTRFISIVLLGCLAVACDDPASGEHPQGGEPGPCTARCAYEQSCDPQADCETFTCLQGEHRFRPEASAKLVACYEQLTCSDSDTCFESTLQALPPRDIDQQFRDACKAVQSTCGTFVDDYCFLAPMFESVFVDQATTCLDMGCDAVAGCIEQTFGF
jgi:hypothetical protein